MGSVVVNGFMERQGQRGKTGGSAAATHSATNITSKKDL